MTKRNSRAVVIVLLTIGSLALGGGVANAEAPDCAAWNHEADWIMRNQLLYGGVWDAVYETWDAVGTQAGC
jgi:hypothetical protein